MHRTGIVWGVIQKCIAKMNINDVLNEYRCNVGYESESNPGGFKINNEIVIKNFPCDCIK